MKKISNSVKISVPNNGKNVSTKNEIKIKQQELKVQLNEIQRISQEIQEQMSRNKQSKEKDQHKLATNNVQQKHSDYEEEDSSYWPDQNNKTVNTEKTILQKAVQQSIQKYFGLSLQNQKQNDGSHTLVNRKQRFVDIQCYEEYKRTKQFNKSFQQIFSKLQSLRRLSLSSSNSKLVDLQSQSSVISLIHEIIKSQSKSNDQSNESHHNSTLQTIQKLEEIEEAIETRLQQLRDQMEYKQKIVQQLKTNQRTIQDDTLLLQNRNQKLKRQLQSIQGNIQAQNSSQEQQLYQQNQNLPLQIQSQLIQNSNIQPENQPDYQKEYLELMHYYQLYNPQTNSVEQPFPKNKTEAMILLNNIQNKIQKLQMQKAVKGFSL